MQFLSVAAKRGLLAIGQERTGYRDRSVGDRSRRDRADRVRLLLRGKRRSASSAGAGGCRHLPRRRMGGVGEDRGSACDSAGARVGRNASCRRSSTYARRCTEPRLGRADLFFDSHGLGIASQGQRLPVTFDAAAKRREIADRARHPKRCGLTSRSTRRGRVRANSHAPPRPSNVGSSAGWRFSSPRWWRWHRLVALHRS